MLNAMEGGFGAQAYRYVRNRDTGQRDAFRKGLLEQYARLNYFLMGHSPSGPFLFEYFGLAETVFAPFFIRFWFLKYYEDFDLPREAGYVRICEWRDACLAHPAVQQVTGEEVVKLYYAQGVGNGALSRGARDPRSCSILTRRTDRGLRGTSTGTTPHTWSWGSPDKVLGYSPRMLLAVSEPRGVLCWLVIS